jgi:hypothetical protein
MVRAADALAEARRVPALAGAALVRPDFAPVAARKRPVRSRRGQDHRTRCGHRDHASGERLFRPRKGIVLNPGTDPAIPPIDGLAGTPYWTNRDALAVERVPDSLIVLGGGPVGCEFPRSSPASVRR